MTYPEPHSLSTDILFTPHWPHVSCYEHSNCSKSYPCYHHQNRFKRKFNKQSNNNLFPAWITAPILNINCHFPTVKPILSNTKIAWVKLFTMYLYKWQVINRSFQDLNFSKIHWTHWVSFPTVFFKGIIRTWTKWMSISNCYKFFLKRIANLCTVSAIHLEWPS